MSHLFWACHTPTPPSFFLGFIKGLCHLFLYFFSSFHAQHISWRIKNVYIFLKFIRFSFLIRWAFYLQTRPRFVRKEQPPGSQIRTASKADRALKTTVTFHERAAIKHPACKLDFALQTLLSAMKTFKEENKESIWWLKLNALPLSHCIKPTCQNICTDRWGKGKSNFNVVLSAVDALTELYKTRQWNTSLFTLEGVLNSIEPLSAAAGAFRF